MKIFCDFDGTVAKNDVGNLLFRTFADNRCFDIVKTWKEGKSSSPECWIELCKITKVTREELVQFVDAQQLDPYFPDLVNYCQERNIEVEILSDGLDFYIERILKKNHLESKVNFHSNHMKFLNHNGIRPEFPYYEQGCGHCANCKGYHVGRAKGKTNPLIYVGDGLSDRCGAKEADIVFAKRDRDLLVYCLTNGISYYEFSNFQDILNKVKVIVGH